MWQHQTHTSQDVGEWESSICTAQRACSAQTQVGTRWTQSQERRRLSTTETWTTSLVWRTNHHCAFHYLVELGVCHRDMNHQSRMTDQSSPCLSLPRRAQLLAVTHHAALWAAVAISTQLPVLSRQTTVSLHFTNLFNICRGTHSSFWTDPFTDILRYIYTTMCIIL